MVGWKEWEGARQQTRGPADSPSGRPVESKRARDARRPRTSPFFERLRRSEGDGRARRDGSSTSTPRVRMVGMSGGCHSPCETASCDDPPDRSQPVLAKPAFDTQLDRGFHEGKGRLTKPAPRCSRAGFRPAHAKDASDGERFRTAFLLPFIGPGTTVPCLIVRLIVPGSRGKPLALDLPDMGNVTIAWVAGECGGCEPNVRPTFRSVA